MHFFTKNSISIGILIFLNFFIFQCFEAGAAPEKTPLKSTIKDKITFFLRTRIYLPNIRKTTTQPTNAKISLV